jgi:hypothetical protein
MEAVSDDCAAVTGDRCVMEVLPEPALPTSQMIGAIAAAAILFEGSETTLCPDEEPLDS